MQYFFYGQMFFCNAVLFFWEYDAATKLFVTDRYLFTIKSHGLKAKIFKCCKQDVDDPIILLKQSFSELLKQKESI